MTLLDLIATAAATTPTPNATPCPHPIPLTANPILLSLTQSQNPNPNPDELLFPITGFQLSSTDISISDSNSKFFMKLKRKLKNSKSMSGEELKLMVGDLMKEIVGKLGAEIGEQRELGKLVEEFGCFIGKDVMGLVIEGCLVFENWGLLRILIENEVVDHGLWTNLVYNLVVKRRSDLLCLCVKFFQDFKSSDLWRIIKYFVNADKEAIESMDDVRKEWEGEVELAIQSATDRALGEEKMGLAKEAAVLLMLAYDGFSVAELGLHYVFASGEVDEVVFSDAVGRLNVEETLGMVRYLGKWLRKYERFPQACLCHEAEKKLKLKGCRWVPTLEGVVKSLGLVLDVHLLSLTLHAEFHEELKALQKIASGLASEGRLCCSVVNVIEILKPEVAVS